MNYFNLLRTLVIIQRLIIYIVVNSTTQKTTVEREWAISFFVKWDGTGDLCHSISYWFDGSRVGG